MMLLCYAPCHKQAFFFAMATILEPTAAAPLSRSPGALAPLLVHIKELTRYHVMDVNRPASPGELEGDSLPDINTASIPLLFP